MRTQVWPAVVGMLVPLCAGLTACGRIAEYTTPAKSAATTRSIAAKTADETFWQTFHGGRYDAIGEALEAETRAYLADPRDALTAAHVGWLHMWRVGERARLTPPPASITDDALLARRYFAEAVALEPGEARFQGFLAAATLADASVNQNGRLSVHGYFELRDAIKAWPEFNLFTAGYVLSGQPLTSHQFGEALAWQWHSIDRCIGMKLDRNHPAMRPYLHLEVRTGPKRACWNSWIAPHNFEGFFLNMGDMLVKSGDSVTARAIYANARLSSTYGDWPFREVLEARIREAPENQARFNAADAEGSRAHIMLESPYACMACHQQ